MAATFKIPDLPPVMPWSVLPRQPIGDATKEVIYQAVGAALSAWELLDTQQASLFGEIVGSRARGAEAAYGTVLASTGRTEMVVTAADRAFFRSAPTLLADIKMFVERIGKLAGRRNDIAHGVAWAFAVNDKDLGFYLVPAPYNTRRHVSQSQRDETFSKLSLDEIIENPFGFGPNKYAYTSAQIMEYAGHFNAYNNSMIELVQMVRETCDVLFP